METRTHCVLLRDEKWFMGPLGEKMNELSSWKFDDKVNGGV